MTILGKNIKKTYFYTSNILFSGKELYFGIDKEHFFQFYSDFFKNFKVFVVNWALSILKKSFFTKFFRIKKCPTKLDQLLRFLRSIFSRISWTKNLKYFFKVFSKNWGFLRIFERILWGLYEQNWEFVVF